jgi:hypothetical protein
LFWFNAILPEEMDARELVALPFFPYIPCNRAGMLSQAWDLAYHNSFGCSYQWSNNMEDVQNSFEAYHE